MYRTVSTIRQNGPLSPRPLRGVDTRGSPQITAGVSIVASAGIATLQNVEISRWTDYPYPPPVVPDSGFVAYRRNVYGKPFDCFLHLRALALGLDQAQLSTYAMQCGKRATRPHNPHTRLRERLRLTARSKEIHGAYAHIPPLTQCTRQAMREVSDETTLPTHEWPRLACAIIQPFARHPLYACQPLTLLVHVRCRGLSSSFTHLGSCRPWSCRRCLG